MLTESHEQEQYVMTNYNDSTSDAYVTYNHGTKLNYLQIGSLHPKASDKGSGELVVQAVLSDKDSIPSEVSLTLAIGSKFDLRKCRRTFGQRAINEGQSMHDVSLVMGHSTMATTQKDYCDKDEHDAARDMQRYWDAKEASE